MGTIQGPRAITSLEPLTAPTYMFRQKNEENPRCALAG